MNAPTLPTAAQQVFTPSTRLAHRSNPNPQKLGVFTNDHGGLDIAVMAAHATAVDFCVLEGTGPDRRERRWGLRGPFEGVWHGSIDGYFEGTVYGFRVYGPWDPDGGQYHNPAKLLLDPYGRAVVDKVELSPALHAHQTDEDLYPAAYPLAPSRLNSADVAPHSAVTAVPEPMGPGPKVPWDQTVLYEAHVRGFTMNAPFVPEDLRGTYAGMGHPETVKYLQDLGITSLELLPVQAKMDEPFLTDRGLTNYWGYNTLSFFYPEPTYATESSRLRGPQAVIDEFRTMVAALHEGGIEVILDVVYNHTCEGGDTGPTVSWRGLDSLTYYRYTPHRPRHCIDDTGCGNTLNFSNRRVVQMTLDSLRYWSEQMGVDGFRFDLAVTLGRLDAGYTPYHPLLVAASTDPVLRDRKLIAEPWDIGPGGWQTGNFPIPYSEWNDRYRDSVRSFWLTEMQSLQAGRGANAPDDLATRLSGSSDFFDRTDGAKRGPRASINFLAAHDGFTLADLTSYEHKHNTANLENNRDGSNNNRSWNHGIEGGTANDQVDSDIPDSTGIAEEIYFARERSRRNLLTTLVVSSGTPMLAAGDEFGRTQYGNNNAYCQDNAISWVAWDLTKSQRHLLKHTQYLLRLRALHPVMRPDVYLTALPAENDVLPALSWFDRHGMMIPVEGWSNPYNRVFQMRRSGKPMGDVDLLVVLNGTLDTAQAVLPPSHGGDWVLVNDTSWTQPRHGKIKSAGTAFEDGQRFSPADAVELEPQSMQVYFSDSSAGMRL